MVAFLKANANNGVAPLQLGLIGAWNENLEGHYAMPTWTASGQANTSILDEISAAIKGEADQLAFQHQRTIGR